MTLPRQYIIGVLALVVIGAVIYFGRPDLIMQVNLNLTAEQKATFEEQLRNAQQRVGEITSDTDSEDKAKRYARVAMAYYDLGNYSEARQWFEDAVDIKSNIPVYLGYYNLLTAMHDFKAARDVARDGLEIYPINIDMWRSLIALEQSQFNADTDKVIDLYREAIQKSELQPDLLADFARFQEKLGNIQDALIYWRQAAEKAPEVSFFAEQVKRLESQLR